MRREPELVHRRVPKRPFAPGLGFYKIFWVFFLGCIIGVVVETLWCLATKFYIENRSGVIYGPFNPVYGVGAVVLTLGEQGAVYADSEQTIRQAAYPAEAVDTTAAGDTFTGFFLASLLRGEGVPQAMALAARAAAIAVTRRGAAPSIPRSTAIT